MFIGEVIGFRLGSLPGETGKSDMVHHFVHFATLRGLRGAGIFLDCCSFSNNKKWCPAKL